MEDASEASREKWRQADVRQRLQPASDVAGAMYLTGTKKPLQQRKAKPNRLQRMMGSRRGPQSLAHVGLQCADIAKRRLNLSFGRSDDGFERRVRIRADRASG